VTPCQPNIDWHSFLQRAPLPRATVESIEELRQRPVLITGAGGSIGSGVARRLASEGVELILLEASEAGLYELRGAIQARSTSYLGSTADHELLRDIFARHRPAVVLHTAAFKHVPMLEDQPLAAIANNVFGTEAVTEQAAAHGTRVVLLSTDKAVAPSSVMGATKHVAEKIVLASDGIVVRLANVLGSRGSVSEVFAKQIASGHAMTVTDPASERYFLTLSEAVELLAAAATEKRATIQVPLLTQAHRISELAKFMAKTLAPEIEIPIEITGLRVGERVKEQLWAKDEQPIEDSARGIARIQPAVHLYGSLREHLRSLEESVKSRHVHSALLSLRALVPDYEPSAAVLALVDQPAVAHD